MFEQYISSFSQELALVNYEDFEIEPYPAEYLQLLIKHRTYYLHIYAQVLQKIIQFSAKPKEALVLLDYGAGNGLLGMFAKHCGFKRIYSIDINKSFVQAAQLLNNKLQKPVDVILMGNWNTIVDYCTNHQIPDAMAGTDVIEHIYDVGGFLNDIKALNKAMVTVFTTASVTANPFKTHFLKKLQRQDEYLGSNPQHTAIDNPFAGLPFLEVRKRIIQQHFNLPAPQVETLAHATRGMNKEDLLQATNAFINTKQLPAPIRHPTNTCDPITGNWTEQLLTTREYKELYKSAGFHLHVYNGFYNEWQAGIKSVLLKIVNTYIRFTDRAGRWISAYIVLAGK